MRFHVISLPHTQVTKDFCWCAYTSKVFRFCNMMTSLGHEIFLYAGEENHAKVKEHIPIVNAEDHKKWFPHYDFSKHVFAEWDSNASCWKEMNAHASAAIHERKKPGDFLCIIGGLCQLEIAKAHPDLRCVEWGIGYEGIIPDAFHVFESNAWMHYMYGKLGITDGRFFDTVIPNSFDEEDYEFSSTKSDYLLYLGRLTPRKGLEVVQHLANKGHTIIAAGQGETHIDGVEYVGVVRGKKKSSLLANARALICPTFYIEPFGGVAVEAMLSGTPVITTDFGAFTETVADGLTGFRCSTISDVERATGRVKELNPFLIRKYANQYLTSNVRYKYQAYFERLERLNRNGWYS